MFTVIGVGIAMIIGTAVLNGLVLVQLWKWFVATTFGLPQISIPIAMGLALTIGLFTTQATEQKSSGGGVSWSDVTVAFGSRVVALLLTLFFGWIIHLFM